jgi:hemoglobin/transferrin/lactoferrin receptor protein
MESKIIPKLLLISFFFLINLISAQTIILEGKVIDFTTKNPVENVNIIAIGNNYSATTNLQGEFKLNIPLGEYKLKFSHVSYTTRILSVKISDNNSDTDLVVQLQPGNIPIKNIYVVSTRMLQQFGESPLPLEVITSKEIQEHEPQTVADILAQKPGLALQRDGIWATSISLRGLTGSDLITLVDGNRIETATDLDGSLSLFDLDDIKQVEVIKNASSVLYGTGALGGIINIIAEGNNYTNNFEINGKVSSGVNSVNKGFMNNASLNFSDKTWSLNLNGNYRTADNTNTPTGELSNSGYNDDYFSGSFGWYINDNNKLKVSYQNFKGWDIGIPGGAGLFPTNALVKYSFIKRDLINVQYSIINLIEPLKELTIKFYNQNIYRFVENIPNQTNVIQSNNGQPTQIITVDRITPNVRHYVTGLQLQSNWLFGKNLLLAGIDAWQRNLDSRRERVINHSQQDTQTANISQVFTEYIGEKPLPNSSFRSIGVYAQDEFPFLSDKLKITLGARGDQILVKNDSVSNPVHYYTIPARQKNPPQTVLNWSKMEETDYSWSTNFNIFYNATENIDLTFSYSHSFRSASLEERYKYIDLGSIIRLGNPKLKPEKGNYLDAGIKYFTPEINIYWNVFVNFINNQIKETPGTFEGKNALLSVNTGKSRLYGFDGSAEFHITDNSLLNVSAAYVRGEDIANNTNLPEIAPLNSKISYRYSFPELLSLELSANIFSSQDNIAPGELATLGYVYYNLYTSSTAIRVLNSEVKLYTGCENFTNKSYRNHLSTNRGFIVSEPGRNFFVKLSVNF